MELAPSNLVKGTDLTASLKQHFRVRRLSTIKTKDVLAFREWRSSSGVGPAFINMGSAVCRRILKKAGMWRLLAVHTTARKCELRTLLWRLVDFISHTLDIPKSKTEAGVRVIPLNAEAYKALLRLRRRAEAFGTVEPSHFVFAAFRPRFRSHGKNRVGVVWSEFDPTRAVGSWRTVWRTLTKQAGLDGLRFHDLRHTSISALGEAVCRTG